VQQEEVGISHEISRIDTEREIIKKDQINFDKQMADNLKTEAALEETK